VLAGIGLVTTAFGVSLASALFPLISVEVFVIGVALKGSTLPWWLLAVVIAVGQMGGKLLHYYSAQGVIRLPKFLRPKQNRTGRAAALLDRFRMSCHHRPLWTNGVLLLSAMTSLPPFLATSVVAGWARIPLRTFLIAGFIGRFARFSALAAAPSLVVTLL
jgi:membrane protein YqaA with SNARE-associated domain